MFCTECGKILPEGSFVCPACGTVVSVTGAPAAQLQTAAEMPAEQEQHAEVPEMEEQQQAEVPAVQEQPEEMPVPAVRETDSGFGFCTAGFVLSLIGFFTSVIFVTLIAGLILSGIGVSIAGRDTSHNRAGRGLGIAGIVIAAAGILLRIFFLSAFISILHS